jgi:hypothetical protein
VSRVAEYAYQGAAVLAMVAHVVIVGPLAVVGLAMIASRGTELVALALKVLVAATWIGVGIFGIRAWRDRSWGVIGAPILSFFLIWMLILFGNLTIKWGIILGP